MDIYDRWREIKRKHHLERHTGENYLRNAQGDLSYKLCFGIETDLNKEEIEVIERFRKFWRIIDKIIVKGIEINGYNWVTIINFENLLINREIDEEQKKKMLRRMVWSLTYDERPDFTFGGIMTVIETVIKECMIIKEDGNIIIKDEEVVKSGLLIGRELVRFSKAMWYGKNEKEERFQRFWDGTEI
jgi:hypothetical protein